MGAEMIAREGEHYEIITFPGGMRTLNFLPRGNKELTMFERRYIENAFFAKKLGSSFKFHDKPEYKFVDMEDALDGRSDAQTDGNACTCGLCEECVYRSAEESRIADAQYKERRYDEEFHGESRLGFLGYR